MTIRLVDERTVFVLPHAAREALRRAAATPVSDADPLARMKAINRATEQIRRQYPQFFRSEGAV